MVSISHLLLLCGILTNLLTAILAFTSTTSNINRNVCPTYSTACYGSVSKWNEEYQQSDDNGEYLVHYPWAYILQIIFRD